MKDIFNGKVKYVNDAIAALVIFSVIMAGCGILFLWIAIFYDKFEPGARELVTVFGIVSCFLAIFYPILTIYFIRRMDKYPRISRTFFKKYIYSDKKD